MGDSWMNKDLKGKKKQKHAASESIMMLASSSLVKSIKEDLDTLDSVQEDDDFAKQLQDIDSPEISEMLDFDNVQEAPNRRSMKRRKKASMKKKTQGGSSM